MQYPIVDLNEREPLSFRLDAEYYLPIYLKTDRVNNEYLTLVLNSVLTQEQVNRDVGGSIILHWQLDQVKETVIPILAKETQNKIQQKVSESITLRKQSKHLLECAKKALEMAIEQDEATATKWLEEELIENTSNDN